MEAPVGAAWLAAVILAFHAGPDTVVVCPAEFQQALAPWVTCREAQGHRIALVSNLGTTSEIRARIVQAAAGGPLRAVVLVGDAEVGMEQDARLRARCVPVHWAKAEVNVHFGSEPHIGTDHWCGDLDEDGVPEVAVGRLTADSAEELAAIVQKILAYERSTDFGPWRRQLNFVASAGGFGALADTVIENSAKLFITRNIAPAYEVGMTYGSWRSPFCPDPRRFRETALASINSGCQFWVYIGHGYHLELAPLRVPGAEFPIFSTSDTGQLDCREGRPIALFLSCYAGAFDAYDDCLAEEMLRAPGGPVSVIAASRVTMPYAMSLMALELCRQTLDGPAETLGEALLAAKRQLVIDGAERSDARAALDALAAVVSPMPDKLAEQRREHALLFNLIGDPLLRLRRPKPVDLSVPAEISPGGTVAVAGSSPIDGRAVVELVVPRDRLVTGSFRRSEFPQLPDDWAEFQETYAKANDRRLAWAETEVRGGRFAATLTVPENARGSCHFRVFVEGSEDFGLGAAETTAKPVALARKPGEATVR